MIAIQEVRLDTAFYSLDKKMPFWKDINGSAGIKFDGGSQVEHVLSHLHAAAKRKGLANMDFTKYQFVYQPAMSMWEKNRLSVRNEEGLLILSKYPIIDTKVLFLPRMLGDSGDDHQRLALVAQIELPVKSTGEKALISLSTSHFRYYNADSRLDYSFIASLMGISY